MKKIKWLTLLFALASAFAFASCKNGQGGDSSSDTGGNSNNFYSETADNLDISASSIELSIGETHKLFAVEKDGAAVVFASSDTQIVTVTADGMVTAVNEGKAFVTVTAGETEKVCLVTVKSEAYNLSLNYTELTVVQGTQTEISAIVKLNGETVNANVVWSYEEEENVASWQENGNTTILNTLLTGTVKVTATLNATSASCIVKIMDAQAKTLSSPMLHISNCDSLSWTAVDGASGYAVQVNGGFWQETTSLTYDLTEVADTLESYTVRVKALSSDVEYYDSEAATLEVTHVWSGQAVETEATCMQASKTLFDCENCDRTYEEEGYFAPHIYKDGVCGVCAGYQTPELIYEFDTATQSYTVAGIQNTFQGGAIYVAGIYNDCTAGSYPVTAVKDKAFNKVRNITKVVLPESVTSIGADAFYYNSSLETVVMPGVTNIGGNAFLACMNLKAIVVDKAFNLNAQVFCCNIGGYVPLLNVFVNGLASDSNIVLGGNNNMFTGYKYYAPIGESASCGEWEFDENGDVTYTVHSFEFDYCSNCSARDPKGISYEYEAETDSYTVIGLLDTFEGNLLYIPDTYDDGVNGEKPVTKIGNAAFIRNAEIERVVLAESVTELGMDAFFRMSALRFVSMKGVVTLNGNAFTNSPLLETVVVNPELNAYAQNFNVAATSFPDYEAKVDVYVNGTETGDNFYMQNRYETSAVKDENGNPTGETVIVWRNNMFTGKIYYYDASLSDCGTWAWTDGIENGTIDKREAHIYGEDGTCTNLDKNGVVCARMDGKGVVYTYDATTDSYTVTDGTKATGAVELYTQFSDGKNGLKNVTAIGENAFYLGNNAYNTAITSITVPNTVTVIGKQAFAYCSGLTEITLPDSVVTLQTQAFWRCINLETVIMTGVRTFEESNVFLSCSALKTLVVGSSLYVNIQIASTTTLSQVGQCTIYVSATQENAGSVSVFHNEIVGATEITGSPNNALLKKEVVYMSGSETERGWYYDEDGNVQVRTVE